MDKRYFRNRKIYSLRSQKLNRPKDENKMLKKFNIPEEKKLFRLKEDEQHKHAVVQYSFMCSTWKFF
ncbi:hypothetical protein TNCV_5007191 [Trichonephila clavipes]|nr:hypothetical protein TNCV_5007191 [Trichonephila clavipes]